MWAKCRHRWHFYIPRREAGRSFTDGVVFNCGSQQLEALEVGSAWKSVLPRQKVKTRVGVSICSPCKCHSHR